MQVEDIIESLAYSSKQYSELIAGYIGNEFAMPLAGVKGYTDLLLLAEDRFTDEQKRHHYQGLSRYITYIGMLRDYIFDTTALNHYPERFEKWQPMSIDDVVKQAIAHLPKGDPDIQVEYQIANHSLKINSNGHLHKAIAYLLYDHYRQDLQNRSQLQITEIKGVIQISIVREFAHEIHHISADDYARALRYPSGFGFLAKTFIQQHKSEIHVYGSSEGIAVEFSLPIWHENA